MRIVICDDVNMDDYQVLIIDIRLNNENGMDIVKQYHKEPATLKKYKKH